MKTIHLDLDGVLVNFTDAVFDVTGHRWGEMSSTKIWKKIRARAPDIFAIAKPMPDANVLVDGVLEFADRHGMVVEILTAVPLLETFSQAEADKIRWIELNFPVLTSRKFKTGPKATDKHKHAEVGDILIDDSHLNIRDWARVGGIPIHHVSAEESLSRLRTIGFRRMKMGLL